MKVYISGKITGDPDYRAKFAQAAERVRAAGHEPHNPAADSDESVSWQANMRRALRDMLTCDGVAQLPGWAESRGAKIEYWLALQIGIPVHSVFQWLTEAQLMAFIRANYAAKD